MISVVQCLNCKTLLNAWEKRGDWHKDDGRFQRVIYQCSKCGHYTAVSVTTTKDIEDVMPTPSAKRK